MKKIINIIRAQPEDHLMLTELTLLSKAHWGYTAKQVDSWKDILLVSPSFIEQNGVFKICEGENCFGYYAYIKEGEESVTLDRLFIHPGHIGHGYGSSLMDDFLKRIKKEGIANITVESDPNAELFYQRYGFRVIAQNASSIKGRYLPLMKKEI